MRKMQYEAKTIGKVAVAVVVAVVLLLVVYRCPFYSVFGVPCPGCNMTRALLRAAALDFRGAFWFHPLFPLPVIFAVVWLICFLRGNWRLLKDKRLLYTTLGLFLIVYVIRMILYFPHHPPMEWNDHSILARIISSLGG